MGGASAATTTAESSPLKRLPQWIVGWPDHGQAHPDRAEIADNSQLGYSLFWHPATFDHQR